LGFIGSHYIQKKYPIVLNLSGVFFPYLLSFWEINLITWQLILILYRIGKEKRCLKFLKKRLGSHDLAKRKREEMQNVLQAMRKKAAA
jgi:hypothetical protein